MTVDKLGPIGARILLVQQKKEVENSTQMTSALQVVGEETLSKWQNSTNTVHSNSEALKLKSY